MRLIIAGSRSIIDTNEVRKAITDSTWTPTEIISGGARGVDKIGEELAAELDVDLVIFPANWKKYGKAAGFNRNRKMVWYANLFNQERNDDCPDNLKGGLIAVWNGKSKGTKNIIGLAQANNLPLHVHKVLE